MPREMFPVKKLGDGLGFEHVNNLGRVVSNLSGGNQGSGLQGSHGWITGQAGQVGPFLRLAKVVEETPTTGVYTIILRYWDESDSLWKDEEDEYEMDTRGYSSGSTAPQVGLSLSADDIVTVRYDGQRGVWVPCASPSVAGTQIISFIIRSNGTFVGGITDPTCLHVQAEVVNISCGGSGVAVGDEVTIWDPAGCFFNVPVDILLYMQGMAVKMAWDDTNPYGICHPAAPPPVEPVEGECWWKVISLSCIENIYDEPSEQE